MAHRARRTHCIVVHVRRTTSRLSKSLDHLALVRSFALPTLLIAAGAFAQQRTPPRITFDLIGVNDGLPHASVDRFLEDEQGLLWIGMQQGLAVYDGNAFIPVELENNGGPIAVRNLAMDENGII